MPHFVAVGQQWKRVRSAWVAPYGSWRRVVKRWVGNAGSWRLKFSSGTLGLVPATIRSFCYAPDIPESSITFNPDGSQVAGYTDQTVGRTQNLMNWFDPIRAAAGAQFEIRAVVVGGINGAASGAALNTWLKLDAARQWSLRGAVNALNQTRAVTLEISIRSLGSVDPEVTTQIALSTVAYATSNPNSNYGKGGGVDTSNIDRFYQ